MLDRRGFLQRSALLSALMIPGSSLLPPAAQSAEAAGSAAAAGSPGGATGSGPSDADASGAAIRHLTGQVSGVHVAVPAATSIARLPATFASRDVDLKAMSSWAMNYLVRTPREELGYQPVFQCYPLKCPPVPPGDDPIVACDTDARMDWEWYYMREISGSTRGTDIERAFHQRIRDYVDAQGMVWSPPGSFFEGDPRAKYARESYIVHIWGATKVLQSMAEDYARTGSVESRETGKKIVRALRSLATTDDQGRAWFAGGMGGWRNGTWLKTAWSVQPAPIVGPLVRFWQVTGDQAALDFAIGYAKGIMTGAQPGGLRFNSDGSFVTDVFGFKYGHSHATMHALWGIAELGLATRDPGYLQFVERSWIWMLSRGTGTGWFPAGPDSCDETCCLSDMISIAAVLGRSGQPLFFDDVERYMRNYIAQLQFVVTPEFRQRYLDLHRDQPEQAHASLRVLEKFQGGIIGGSGLNDYDNELLGGVSGFAMYGCCAPEGMRAIHTAWAHTIDRYAQSALGPAGVYVNLSFTRDSQWGRVASSLPDSGRLSVRAAVDDDFLIRVPSWAPRQQVHAFRNAAPVKPAWRGDYLHFAHVRAGEELSVTYPLLAFEQQVAGLWSGYPGLEMHFEWVGNTVVRSRPQSTLSPLFVDRPRLPSPEPPPA